MALPYELLAYGLPVPKQAMLACAVHRLVQPSPQRSGPPGAFEVDQRTEPGIADIPPILLIRMSRLWRADPDAG